MTGVGWLDGTLAVLGILGGGGVLAALVTRRVRPVITMPELIDQVQEERNGILTRVGQLELRVEASARRERIRDDYIHLLRQHIANGNPPPPPPWPPELNT